MSRTVSQTLLDAIQNQQGETILRVKTWLNLAAYNAAPTVPEQTWQTNKFKIEGTEAEAALISETNDYTVSDFTVFLIERGVSISGVEYVTQSGLYFVSKFEEKAGRINIKGSSFPDQKIVIDGDDTYENVITDFCTEIGKTAVFKDTGAAWLSYQFLPAGKQVILNKAERFLNLIRQKYLIQCYERSPKELVFYHAATDQSEWKDIIFADSVLVIISTNGVSEIGRSTDGLAFSKIQAPSFTNSITYSPTLDLFVAVGSNVAMSSPDGITWTSRTIPAGFYNGVTFGNSLFVAVGSSGACSTSPDGITWTSRTIPSAPWISVTWAEELSLFCAVSDSSTNGIATSPDGITWTIRSANTNSKSKIIWSSEAMLFVVTCLNGDIALTSPDGTTWTQRSMPAGAYSTVAYSPTLDLFLAMGDNLAATSPDGITWTSRTAPADQAWQAVTWADDLAQFIAVSSDGDNRIASSTDGINWQILTAQADYSLSYLDGPTSSILHGTNTVHYISRDFSGSINTSGDTSYPAWNLGALEGSAPATNTDPFYKFFLQKAPLRLDITDGDRIHFEPSWTLDPTLPIDAMTTIVEIFDSTKSPAWYQEIRSLALFDSVEGGSLPSTIERVAAYTPLVSSGFDGNLTPSVNNLQALAEAVDRLSISGTPPPTTTAANDFQVGDGLGAWVKKTFAQTITILRTSLDTIYQALDSDLTAIAGLSPTNDDIIQRKSGSWVNRTLAQLATDMTELIQDIVGAMLTGNTETNITVTYQDSDGTIDFEVTGGSGGAYSSVSSQSVTTSNISAAEGTFYNLDLSGLTADRDFTLPTPSAAGKFIGLRVNVGDATYELLVKRNGSEVTRVFISGETLEFVSTGTGAGDWIVFRDGRIPSFCILERQSAQSVASSSYPVKIQLTTKVTDIGDIGDAVTNYRITARRANKYNILGVVIFANSFSDQSNVQSLVHVNNALDTYQITYISTTLTNQPGMARAPYERSLASGDYVELIGYHNQGVAVNTGTTVGYPHLSIKEILEPL